MGLPELSSGKTEALGYVTGSFHGRSAYWMVSPGPCHPDRRGRRPGGFTPCCQWFRRTRKKHLTFRSFSRRVYSSEGLLIQFV